MLSETKQFFFQLIRDHIDGKPSGLPGNVDVSELAELFRRHNLGGMMLHQLNQELKGMPEQEMCYKKLYQEYLVCVSVYQKRKTLLEKVHRSFQENGIAYLIFKGTELAELYPQPALRTMGDSDILVHPGDKEKSHELLSELGFTNRSKGPNEWVYDCGGLEFELHHRMMNDEAGNYDSHKAFFGRAWEYAKSEEGSVRYRFDCSYHLVYLLTHLRKHFIDAGVGFRQFLDIALVVSRCEVDWDWVRKELEQMDMTAFAEMCFYFCKRWFGISAPLIAESVSEDFYEMSVNIIFENGVFGTDNEENANNYAMFQVRESGGRKKTVAVKRFFAMVFPEYNVMKEVRQYSFINGRPWLLPAAWVYRFMRVVLGKKDASALHKTVSSMQISEETLQKRNELLEKWGI